MAITKITYQPAQAAEAAEQERLERRRWNEIVVTGLRQMLPTAFLESLPKTMNGYTQTEADYWLEPEVEPIRPDSHKILVSGIAPCHNSWIANSMAPRFLNGVSFWAEEVLPGEEMVEGNVYCLQYIEELSFAGTIRAFRYLRKKQGSLGMRMIIQDDADACPDWTEDGYAWRHPNLRLYRFLRYESFAEVACCLPTAAFPRRNWDALYANHVAYEQHREKERARRRELYAQRKQPKAQEPSRPVIGFSKIKRMPAEVGGFQRRKAA
ncbi:hypothetical protein [Hymenobacter guriensis]|uniref:Uncharacterized protein n=1 Tax=Hymenobacter guriensis TaxID=2793065 RepID=A0ABS0L8F3_9BACT|nr:hypothetical protein [Hymenobacter guriensis]MBG8556185.1 hypothetical protein [Hymenobacter guriensis]